MKREGARYTERVVSTLMVLSLFLVLASQVYAQPYTAGPPAPSRQTSVQDITDNQEKMKERLDALTNAMTDMKTSMEEEINYMRRTTILFLAAIYFFYVASTALWKRVIRYRHWQKHIGVKGKLETDLTKMLKEQNQLLKENNELLSQLKDTLAAIKLVPESAQTSPPGDTAAITDTKLDKEAKGKRPLKATKKPKKASRLASVFRWFLMLVLLALASTIAHFYVFDQDYILTAGLAILLFFVIAWINVIVLFIRWRRKKGKKPAEKSESQDDKSVKISHEISKENTEKLADSDSKEKVEEKSEEKRIHSSVDKVEKDQKDNQVFESLKKQIAEAEEDQKKVEAELKKPPVEEKEPDKRGFWDKLFKRKEKPTKEELKEVKPEEVPDEFQKIYNDIMSEMAPEPREPEKTPEKPSQEPSMELSPIEQTILDYLHKNKKKSTGLREIYRLLPENTPDEIKAAIEKSIHLKRQVSSVEVA